MFYLPLKQICSIPKSMVLIQNRSPRTKWKLNTGLSWGKHIACVRGLIFHPCPPVDTPTHGNSHTHGNWHLELKQHLKIQSRTLQKKILLLVAGQWLCGYWPNVTFERNSRAGTGVCFSRSFHWHLWRMRKHYMALAEWFLKGKYIPKVTLKSFCCYKLVVTSKVVVRCLGLG